MITFLEGELIERQPTRAVIACGGVGYELSIPLSTFDRLPERGPCRILTRLVVREDAHLLFGFASPEERAIFDLLLGVSRVGPKLAMAVLSGMSVPEIRRAIAFEDVGMLARVSGVGRKTAERIVVELKDKIDRASAEVPGSASPGERGLAEEAIAALMVLGYTRSEAQESISRAAKGLKGATSTEELLRQALSGTAL
ncbi:MAG: Holliday junction branch migration protein RuvA [candidate division Zixibacteria bacterium]|nr:Holliday junction branch migration protein RuvA [candidate division Zixibacteria bacterium]